MGAGRGLNQGSQNVSASDILAPQPSQPAMGGQQTNIAGIQQQGVIALYQMVAALKSLEPNTSPIFNTITLDNNAAGQTPLGYYSEGTWTPSLKFGGAAVAMAYNTQAGSYTRIGRQVTCYFDIVLTSSGSSTGAATISGLPYASNVSLANAGSGGGVNNYTSLSVSSGTVVINIGAGSSVANILITGTANTTAGTNSNFTNSSQLAGTFSYFV